MREKRLNKGPEVGQHLAHSRASLELAGGRRGDTAVPSALGERSVLQTGSTGSSLTLQTWLKSCLWGHIRDSVPSSQSS